MIKSPFQLIHFNKINEKPITTLGFNTLVPKIVELKTKILYKDGIEYISFIKQTPFGTTQSGTTTYTESSTAILMDITDNTTQSQTYAMSDVINVAGVKRIKINWYGTLATGASTCSALLRLYAGNYPSNTEIANFTISNVGVFDRIDYLDLISLQTTINTSIYFPVFRIFAGGINYFNDVSPYTTIVNIREISLEY